MNKLVVAVSCVALAAVAAGGGFISGTRYANAWNIALSYEQTASFAGESARYLTAVRAGKMQLTTQYFEDRIDTAFANLTPPPTWELSRAARAELKLAAEYRRQFPSAKRNPDWDSRVEKGMSWVR
jgi:hypothetical protein